MRLSDPSSGSCTPPALPPPRAVTCPPTRCGAPTGVIDWGDVCAGDPAIDLATTLLAYALDQRLPHVEAECRRALVAAVS